MRTLADHIVEGDSANHRLTVNVIDEPGHGGACHNYSIGWNGPGHPGKLEFGNEYSIGIQFQNGPIKEFGVNGVTHEALLAVLIDRLKGFQSGQYACQDNQEALYHLRQSLEYLHKRTVARIARGIEGTHEA